MALKSNFAALLILVAAGLHAETIVTKNGERFEDARVTTVTPATITIFHRVGVATIALADLPADLQKRYVYDSVKAQAWVRQQAIAAEKQRDQAETAADKAKQDRKQKEVEIQEQMARMQSLVNAVYDSSTRQWYASPEAAAAAREQALKAALEAKRALGTTENHTPLFRSSSLRPGVFGGPKPKRFSEDGTYFRIFASRRPNFFRESA